MPVYVPTGIVAKSTLIALVASIVQANGNDSNTHEVASSLDGSLIRYGPASADAAIARNIIAKQILFIIVTHLIPRCHSFPATPAPFHASASSAAGVSFGP